MSIADPKPSVTEEQVNVYGIKTNNSSPSLVEPVTFTAAEQAEIDEFCAKHGSDIKKVDEKHGTTLLYKAATEASLAVVKFLIAQGADVNAPDKYNSTPLHGAAGRYRGSSIENLNIIKFLVFEGANANAKTLSGVNPLWGAVWAGNTEIVKFLVSHGADVNVKGTKKDILEGGDTLLHRSARYNKHADIVKYLVAHGAKVNAKNDNGDTPLQVAKTSNKAVSAITEYLTPLTTAQSTGILATLDQITSAFGKETNRLQQQILQQTRTQQTNGDQLPVHPVKSSIPLFLGAGLMVVTFVIFVLLTVLDISWLDEYFVLIFGVGMAMIAVGAVITFLAGGYWTSCPSCGRYRAVDGSTLSAFIFQFWDLKTLAFRRYNECYG